jgi:hypothetical protein
MPAFSPSQQNAIAALARDLDDVFGSRLQALVAYPGSQGDGSIHSCAIVDGLGFQDLVKCLPFTGRWGQRRVAVPLMLSGDELRRTLDIFPLEYAAIAADHVVVRGADPFAGLAIPAADLRRAIEAQAKSHLIHLREAYLESSGDATRIAGFVSASAAPLRALLTNIARLPDDAPGTDGAGRSRTTTSALPTDDALAGSAEARMGVSAAVLREVLALSGGGASSVTDASHLFSRYLDATQKIWEFVDGWSR